MGIPSTPPMPHSPSVVISNPVTEAPSKGLLSFGWSTLQFFEEIEGAADPRAWLACPGPGWKAAPPYSHLPNHRPPCKPQTWVGVHCSLFLTLFSGRKIPCQASESRSESLPPAFSSLVPSEIDLLATSACLLAPIPADLQLHQPFLFVLFYHI